MNRYMLVMLSLAACSKAEPTGGKGNDGPGVAPPPPEVAVELAGVTLADDCPDGRATKPVPPPPTMNSGKNAAAASEPIQDAKSAMKAKVDTSAAAGACADPSNCKGPSQPPCEQTSMQLSLRAPAGVPATKLVIKKVELLDEAGAVVGTLAARTPTKWDGSATYVTWDESIAAGQTLVASYRLAAPDWNTLVKGGRWNAQSKRFKLRVTVSVGNKDRTVEKQSITPAMPEPEVAT